ncbi:AraC family transcriptional regulator [Streptomyces sp. MST-110588]|uniref:AraC family transcriptional regulator n=1 Tax=Streptomyces sp. MST-110588 TaxID=2833628 RepID=UPI001F5D0971|nr:AraC family transcriptional regulator [Streptomyces sp. MST-110588]UNO40310.1 AraC family transcriptional regulator [Streptomyces sp. MST-110588]
MDPLADLLDGPRARGAFLLRSVLDPPWSVRVEDRAPLTLLTMSHRDACVTVPGDRSPTPDAVRLRPGDLAILRGPDPYTVADSPETAARPPRVIIHPGQISATPEGDPLCEAMDLGIRTWGDAPQSPEERAASDSAIMLSGTYQLHGEINQPLLRALPALALLPAVAAHPSLGPLLSLLAEEIGRDEPGQDVVLDRLLDLLLVAALRLWFSRPEAQAPPWYRAQSDPVVGRALRFLHEDPARPWTVSALAAATGVSRAALGRRFTRLVGEPPMTYLTHRRLDLAADLLREPDLTIGAVARRVGYGSSFALSTAFKRVRGISPQDHRNRHLPQPPAPPTLPAPPGSPCTGPVPAPGTPGRSPRSSATARAAATGRAAQV